MASQTKAVSTWEVPWEVCGALGQWLVTKTGTEIFQYLTIDTNLLWCINTVHGVHILVLRGRQHTKLNKDVSRAIFWYGEE